MNSDFKQRLAAVAGFLAVVLGAFGAHALKDILEAHHTAEIWKTAASYHLVHSVVLLFSACFQGKKAQWSWYSFLAGIILFSGSLYVLAVSGIKWVGVITPLGGILLLAGWLLLFWPQSVGKNQS